MNEEFNNMMTVPTYGIAMDPSKLFGMECSVDGLVRAVGPENCRSRWAVIPEVAKVMSLCWMPDSDFIAHLLNSDAQDEALNEAHQFLREWDTMAKGATEAWIVQQVVHHVIDDVRFALNGIARVDVHEDGLVYLTMPNGAVSRHGLRPEVAWPMVANWDGLDGAADLATEYLSDPYDHEAIGKALMARWDAEAGAMPPGQREQTYMAAFG